MRLILILTLAAARPALAGAQSFDVLVARAAGLEAAGRYQDAATLLKRACALRPAEYGARMRLAEDYVRLGRLASAKAQFRLAREIAPRQADAYVAEGYAELDAGKYSDARRAFADLIAVDTASFAGYHHMGAFLSFAGRPNEAEPYFRKAMMLLESDPRSSPRDRLHSLTWLGMTLLKQRRLGEAERVLRLGLQSASRSADTADYRATFLEALALLRAKQGCDPEAEGLLLRALSVATKARDGLSRAEILSQLAGLYLRRRRLDRARGATNELLATPQTVLQDGLTEGSGAAAQWFEELGAAWAKAGDRAIARRCYARVLSFPGLPDFDEAKRQAYVAVSQLERRP